MTEPVPGRGLAAHAKVNLALAVTSRRADGYHELRSVFLRLELADTLELTEAGGTDGDRLDIEGDPSCPLEGNLVLRAVSAFRAAAGELGMTVPPVRMRLVKRIPMAAGLAGGSSDGAAALRLLASGYPDQVPPGTLERLAPGIGADVPFFLDGAGAGLVAGIGEALEPLPPPISPLGVLLVTPPLGASTAAVFGTWDTLAATGPTSAATGHVDRLADRLRAGVDAASLADDAALLRDANDLWRPASLVVPGLAELRAVLELRLGRPVLLTGSGSTLFAVYASPAEAATAAADLGSAGTTTDLRIIATCSTGPYIPVIKQWRET